MRWTIIHVIFFALLTPLMESYYSLTRLFNSESYAYWELAILAGYYGYILMMAGLAYGHWYIIMTAIKKMAIVFTSDIKVNAITFTFLVE